VLLDHAFSHYVPLIPAISDPGLTYELGIAIHQQKLVWIRGPEQSGKGDLQNFRAQNGLKSKIPCGKKVADVRRFKRRARARHEMFNGRCKNFSVLSEMFRHGHENKCIFKAVCVIVTQYKIENGHPLFDVQFLFYMFIGLLCS
jgi:hypothetical protein